MPSLESGTIGGTYAACHFAADGTIASRLNVESVVHTDTGDYAITLTEGIDDDACAYFVSPGLDGETRKFAYVNKTGTSTFRVVTATAVGSADCPCSLLVIRTNIG